MRIKIYWKLSLLLFSAATSALAALYLLFTFPANSIIIPIFMVSIAALLAGISASVMIARPLHAIASVMRRFAKGDFSKRAIVRRSDEIGDLAVEFNRMADNVEARIEKLSGERAKLEAILSSMFEGIMLTDERGRVLLMNPSVKNLLLVHEAPEGRRPLEVIRNIAIQDMVDDILRPGQKVITREVTTTLPEEKIILINGVPVARDGRVEGAVLVFHDITELRRLEKIRQDFVANVSHELRTPISSIKGYAETLLETPLKEEENIRDFVNIIHQESNRLADLIDDLLDLSKIESGKLKLRAAPVDMKETVNRCVKAFQKPAQVKSITLTLDIPEDLPKVLGEEKRLYQVLSNLLDNAIKYTPEGGSVKIRAFPTEDFAQIEVSDTGIGIPENDLPRIFERFYRVDKARSRELGGTGLGLSIAKHIVGAHNGRIWVESTAGGGAAFSFTIPIQK